MIERLLTDSDSYATNEVASKTESSGSGETDSNSETEGKSKSKSGGSMAWAREEGARLYKDDGTEELGNRYGMPTGMRTSIGDISGSSSGHAYNTFKSHGETTSLGKSYGSVIARALALGNTDTDTDNTSNSTTMGGSLAQAKTEGQTKTLQRSERKGETLSLVHGQEMKLPHTSSIWKKSGTNSPQPLSASPSAW